MNALLKTMELVNIGEENGLKTLGVTALWEEISTEYDDIVAEYSKVKISGFRPGKAPRYVVEKRFQREITDELLRRCGRRLGREALDQAGMEPMGPVELAAIECGKDMSFKFTAKFNPMPEFELPGSDLFTFDNDGTDPRDLISNRLLELIRFEVPGGLIRGELGAGAGDGIDEKSIEWKAAADRVRLLLILKRIARREGIEVDESDVERRIKEKAAEFGTSPEALKTELGKGGGLQRLRDILLAESTLDFLIEKAIGKNIVD